MVNDHWSGYSFAASNVTGVRAEWSEPTVTGPSRTAEDVWVGIGGLGQNLIQAGTAWYRANGSQTSQEIWYELIPAPPRYPLIVVNPGDRVSVSIVRIKPSPEQWRISVTDYSSGQAFSKIVKYDSAGNNPSFVVEDPGDGSPSPSGPFVPFAHWGRVTFANMAVDIAGRWVPAASLSGYQIRMVRDGHTLATTGPLDDRSGFTVTQG